MIDFYITMGGLLFFIGALTMIIALNEGDRTFVKVGYFMTLFFWAWPVLFLVFVFNTARRAHRFIKE